MDVVFFQPIIIHLTRGLLLNGLWLDETHKYLSIYLSIYPACFRSNSQMFTITGKNKQRVVINMQRFSVLLTIIIEIITKERI